ncbi:MAG TPA: acyl-CoA synthetase [Pseudonocardiaceae bacterium]
MAVDVGRGLRRAVAEARAVSNCVRAGMLGLEAPAKLAAGSRALRRFGLVGGAIGQAAAKHPDTIALVDELGRLSFTDLENRSNALANRWLELGVRAGDGIGILCRNHRGFFDALFASAKVGAKTLLLNTDFAGPQLRDVCRREDVRLLVHDEEFAAVVEGADAPLGTYVAWSDAAEPPATALQHLVDAGRTEVPPKPAQPQKIVLLTSGTTGTPKGAPRPMGISFIIPGGLLSKIPYRSGDRTLVAAPLFHAWGLLNATTAIALGATVVTRRRFDPAHTLDDLERHRCTGLSVVPIMLQRLIGLGAEEIRRRKLDELRIIAVSGSQLSAELATRAMDVFGDIVYNLYGSTEVSYATIATPEDLRAAPGCVGSSPAGTTVEVVDENGARLPAGRTGRIFVGNLAQFTGYTGGGNKEIIRGLMSSGDVGHFDENGRLWVDGRDDEMIVSGGENLFPREVEELLATHEGIDDVAVIGVPDEEFGQRLRAFVVRRPGAELDASAVKEFVRGGLARFKAPRDVIFLDSLPRNPTGKVLKRELAAYDGEG